MQKNGWDIQIPATYETFSVVDIFALRTVQEVGCLHALFDF